METIGAVVGRQPALNSEADQVKVQTLLNRIPKSQGVAEGSLNGPIHPGNVSPALQAAIDTFQRVNVAAAHRDGRVAPNGETIQTLNEIAGTSGPVQVPWGTLNTVAPPVADFAVPGVPQYGQLQMGFPRGAGENACWWAAIKMVRDTGGVMTGTAPPEMVTATKALDIVAIEAIYPRYGMYPAYPSPTPPTWTAAALVKALQEKGPMVACGRFAAGDQSTNEYTAEGQRQHAIVVYGVATNGSVVMTIDPWTPSVRRFLLEDFNARLHVGKSRLIAAMKHIHTWQTVPQAQG